MKIIIDTDKKEIGAENAVNIGEFYSFLEKHGFVDYGLMGVNPYNPSVFPVKFSPSYHSISNTGDIIPSEFMDEAIKFGYQRIDPNKYKNPLVDKINPRLSGIEELNKTIDGIQ